MLISQDNAAKRTLLSIVIPMCNEEESIDLLREKLALLQERISASYAVEYCLVDDGSTDATAILMASAVPSGATSQTARHVTNLGLGAAIRSGFQVASGEIVCTIDADCSYAPENLCTLIEMIASGQCDVAVASPYHPDGAVVGVRAWRLFLSKQCSRLYRSTSPLKLYTYTSIFRAYRRIVAKQVPFKSDHFVSAVEVLLNAQRQGYRVNEAPMVLYVRQRGYSKMRILRTILSHLSILGEIALSKPLNSIPFTRRRIDGALAAGSHPVHSATPAWRSGQEPFPSLGSKQS